MFRKQDFKKVDLLGSGKKNTKIYKAEHIPTGKYYALKEVEAKTLEKLNEYKVSFFLNFLCLLTMIFEIYRRKQYNYSKYKITQTCFSSTDTISMRLCIIPLGLLWSVSTWSQDRIWSICLERESSRISSGGKTNLKK